MMRALVFVLVCLWAMVNSNHYENMEMSVCDDCSCTAAQAPSALTEKYNDDLDCVCFCGSKKSEKCKRDNDCIHGLHCAAGHVKGGHGKCENACKKPGVCPSMFDKCTVDESNQPVCKCENRPCSNITIGDRVCAFDPDKKERVTFNNDCEFVNADCTLRDGSGPLKLEKLAVHDCAVVVQRNPHAGERFDGFHLFDTLF